MFTKTATVMLMAILGMALIGQAFLSPNHKHYFTHMNAQENPSAKDSASAAKDTTDWKEKLSPEQYRVAREGGTERAFQNKYYLHKEKGMYHCVCCNAPLFSSETKYDSGSGWPAFWDVVDKDKVRLLDDYKLGMKRTEVRCGNCDAHLGHVFEDGPKPTGQRYCINSASLEFEGKDE